MIWAGLKESGNEVGKNIS